MLLVLEDTTRRLFLERSKLKNTSTEFILSDVEMLIVTSIILNFLILSSQSEALEDIKIKKGLVKN